MMQQEPLKNNRSTAQAAWRIYFALAILQTCLALALLLRIRSVESAGVVFGVSPVRLVFALGLAVLVLLFLWLFLETWIRPQLFERHWSRLVALSERRQLWNGVVFLCAILFLLGILTLAQMTDVEEPFVKAFFDRLQPIVIWVTGLSGQTVIALLFLRHGRAALSLRPQGRLFYFTLFVLAVILLGWSWVASTIVPAESQRVGWNLMGVPIVEWQVLVAWLAGVLMLVALAYLDRPSSRPSFFKRFTLRWFDLLWVFLIWLAAVIVWQSVPLSPSWFLSDPVPPNHEYYPNSDAQAYDGMAQTALVGEGYLYYTMPYARRPLLAMYLTVLHLLGGQSYQRVIFLQVLILAWIPVLIYLLTKALHNRISGVMAASLIIIREANSIFLTERITTSHVKLLMADLPAMLVTVLFVLLGIHWLQNIAERKLLGLACGGMLGLAMLIRPEAFVFTFPLLLINALILWKDRQWRLWLQSSLLFGLGMFLVISPWILRNYAVTGDVFFDSPMHNTSLIFQRFQRPSGTPAAPREDSLAPLTNTGLSTPVPTPALGSPQVTRSILPAVRTLPMLTTPVPTPTTVNQPLQRGVDRYFSSLIGDPGSIIQASLAHYLNSQIQSFLILPVSFRASESLIAWVGHRSAERFINECCSLVTYIRRVPFWRNWDGRFPLSTLVALVLNLVLVAFGINETWRRHRWTGLAPLAMAVTYMLANAFFRNSGGRYILPVDWTMLVYFSVGLSQLTMSLFGYLRGAPVVEELSPRTEPAQVRTTPLLRSPWFYTLIVGLFLLGSAAPVLEASFPRRYDSTRREAMVSALIRSRLLSQEQRSEVYDFLSRGGVAFSGRALYPRYMAPGVGKPGVGKKSPFAPKPYPRISFYLVGMVNSSLLFAVKNEPESFPNGQDVLVVGCSPEDILLVARFAPDGTISEIYLRSFLGSRLRCPLPEIPDTSN